MCSGRCIPKWRVNEDSSFVVHNDICTRLKLTPDELMEIAMSNTHEQGYVMASMVDVLKSIMPTNTADFLNDMIPSTEPEMYVVTTPSRSDGAIILADNIYLEEIRNTLVDNIFCIPSSKYEIIVLKQSQYPNVDRHRLSIRSSVKSSIPIGYGGLYSLIQKSFDNEDEEEKRRRR